MPREGAVLKLIKEVVKDLHPDFKDKIKASIGYRSKGVVVNNVKFDNLILTKPEKDLVHKYITERGYTVYGIHNNDDPYPGTRIIVQTGVRK
jgi:hypothetical protein